MHSVTAQRRLLSLRIAVVGDPHVGKTSLIERFASSQQGNTHRTNSGFSVHIVELDVECEPPEESCVVQLLIFDVEIASKNDIEVDAMILDSAGAVIVADITEAESIFHLAYYLVKLKSHATDAPIIFAINKIDLPSHPEIVSDGLSFIADAVGIELVYTSAISGAGVDNVFRTLAQKLACSNS